MKITILIPAYNEEKTIRDTIESCINQTRKPNTIIIVNDWSTDSTKEIIDSFWWVVKGLHLKKNTWNKSYAQELAIKTITDDIFITTDGDTVLDKYFVEEIEKTFSVDKDACAVSWYVISLKYNWITACRELDYIIWQDFYKTAQSYINSIYILPWCATWFNTKFFKENITFEHDTIAEDLDFTYKINNFCDNKTILLNKKAIVYTQDPDTIKTYIRQMERWFWWGWQNLKKHLKDVKKNPFIFILTIIYFDWLMFASLIFLLPIFSIKVYFWGVLLFYVYSTLLWIYWAIKRKRIDLFYYSFVYYIFIVITSYVFLTQFYKEVIMNKNTLTWFKPERRKN